METNQRIELIKKLIPYLIPTHPGASRMTEEDMQILKEVYRDIFGRPAKISCCAKPFIESLADWYNKNKEPEAPPAEAPKIEIIQKKALQNKKSK